MQEMKCLQKDTFLILRATDSDIPEIHKQFDSITCFRRFGTEHIMEGLAIYGTENNIRLKNKNGW